MPDDPSFESLMGRLRQGDHAAADEVFRLFAGRLIGLARSRLGGRLQQKVDPEDVAQSVLKSFFLRHAEGQFKLENWDSLWALLTVITLRKCGLRAEFWQAGRRDVRREASTADESARWEAIAREPTPSEAVMLSETVERLLAGLEQRDRPIVELSLQGYTVIEISTQLNLSERTVYRILDRVRSKLERMNSDPPPQQ
jgi:RNA polymerase sigma-70 factor (ECF subfamily)